MWKNLDKNRNEIEKETTVALPVDIAIINLVF